jgi:hypothetical protein
MKRKKRTWNSSKEVETERKRPLRQYKYKRRENAERRVLLEYSNSTASILANT